MHRAAIQTLHVPPSLATSIPSPYPSSSSHYFPFHPYYTIALSLTPSFVSLSFPVSSVPTLFLDSILPFLNPHLHTHLPHFPFPSAHVNPYAPPSPFPHCLKCHKSLWKLNIPTLFTCLFISFMRNLQVLKCICNLFTAVRQCY